jgi:hypothetical protein
MGDWRWEMTYRAGNHKADVFAIGSKGAPGGEGGREVLSRSRCAHEEDEARRKAIFVANGSLFGVCHGLIETFPQSEVTDNDLSSSIGKAFEKGVAHML